jgi:hypothetical protein
VNLLGQFDALLDFFGLGCGLRLVAADARDVLFGPDMPPGTDVEIFVIFSPKNSAKTIAYFDSEQS